MPGMAKIVGSWLLQIKICYAGTAEGRWEDMKDIIVTIILKIVIPFK